MDTSVEAYMTVNSDNLWSCTLCYKSFFDKSSTKRHMKTVHMENQAVKCQICFKTYKNMNALRAHSATHKKNLNA